MTCYPCIQITFDLLVSDPSDGGIKDVRDKDNNIIISDYTLRSLLPPQFKNI